MLPNPPVPRAQSCRLRSHRVYFFEYKLSYTVSACYTKRRPVVKQQNFNVSSIVCVYYSCSDVYAVFHGVTRAGCYDRMFPQEVRTY